MTAEKTQLQAGQIFEKYKIESCIGIGGMSEVYAVQHAFLGQRKAMKLLKLQHAKDERLSNLARAEAMALSLIRHENLVPVTDAGMTPDGLVWMVMPLLEGMTLRAYLDRTKKPTLLEALRIARDVCDGVAAAHEMHITHRDLKPENIFITINGQIIVLDLGMAKFHDFGLKSTGQGRTMGTVRYMSPEHCRGDRVDARTDQYAVGMMLYEMAAGEHPYARGDDGELLANPQIIASHVTRSPAPLIEVIPGFPDDYWEIVRRSTSRERAERYPSMTEMARAIREVRKRMNAEKAAEAAVPVVPTPPPGAQRAYVAPQRASRPFYTEPLQPSQRVITPNPQHVVTPPTPNAQPVSTHAPTKPVALSPTPAPTRTPTDVLAASSPPPRHPIERRTFPERTPPPSTAGETPTQRKRSQRTGMIVTAILTGAVLTVALQLVIRGRASSPNTARDALPPPVDSSSAIAASPPAAPAATVADVVTAAPVAASTLVRPASVPPTATPSPARPSQRLPVSKQTTPLATTPLPAPVASAAPSANPETKPSGPVPMFDRPND